MEACPSLCPRHSAASSSEGTGAPLKASPRADGGPSEGWAPAEGSLHPAHAVRPGQGCEQLEAWDAIPPPPGPRRGPGKQVSPFRFSATAVAGAEVTADGPSRAVRRWNVKRGGWKVQLLGKGTPGRRNSNTVGGSNRQQR